MCALQNAYTLIVWQAAAWLVCLLTLHNIPQFHNHVFKAFTAQLPSKFRLDAWRLDNLKWTNIGILASHPVMDCLNPPGIGDIITVTLVVIVSSVNIVTIVTIGLSLVMVTITVTISISTTITVIIKAIFVILEPILGREGMPFRLIPMKPIGWRQGAGCSGRRTMPSRTSRPCICCHKPAWILFASRLFVREEYRPTMPMAICLEYSGRKNGKTMHHTRAHWQAPQTAFQHLD